MPQAKGAPSPVTADQVQKADAKRTRRKPAKASSEPYAKSATTSTADTGGGGIKADGGPRPADPDVIPTKGKGQNQ